MGEHRPLHGATGLSRKNFSKRKSEKRDTWWMMGNFPAAASLGFLPTQPHGTPSVAQKAPHSYPRPWDGVHPNLWDLRLPILPNPQTWDGAHLTLPHRGTLHPTPTSPSPGNQQRRCIPASADADWQEEVRDGPAEETCRAKRESAIPRKT